jgi:hypothetical protein
VNIWWAALGYFLAYAPYSALAKAMSTGALAGLDGPVSGVAILPLATLASLFGMAVFLASTGWWRSATTTTLAGLRVPRPTRFTLLSGLCTAAILLTTTLAYTFDGVSIVFVMLLMRGGVLVMAPLIDQLSGRSVRWFSWVALGLSMAALLVAFAERGGYAITTTCGINIGVYLAAYFVRLRFMSRLAKSAHGGDNRRFFVEEQLVASPAALLSLALLWVAGPADVSAELGSGFGGLANSSAMGWAFGIGLLSQSTGIFGGLILLDGRENTFCVPVNRASSILAGVAASYLLVALLGAKLPSASELVGAGLVVGAILVLTLGPRWSGDPRAVSVVATARPPSVAGEGGRG